MENIYCVFCSAPFTKEMLEVYEGTYGCESGCETTNVKVVCANCGRICYEKSEFGDVCEETKEEEWQDILERIRSGEIKDLSLSQEKPTTTPEEAVANLYLALNSHG